MHNHFIILLLCCSVLIYAKDKIQRQEIHISDLTWLNQPSNETFPGLTSIVCRHLFNDELKWECRSMSPIPEYLEISKMSIYCQEEEEKENQCYGSYEMCGKNDVCSIAEENIKASLETESKICQLSDSYPSIDSINSENDEILDGDCNNTICKIRMVLSKIIYSNVSRDNMISPIFFIPIFISCIFSFAFITRFLVGRAQAWLGLV
jgi:hypothetical protein